MQWLIFQEFKGDETCTTSFAIEDILRIHCAGWKDVPRFLGELDDVLARTDTVPLDPTLVKTRFVNELRPIPQFKDDFVIWDRMPIADRRYSWLRTAVDTVIMTKRHEDYRKLEVAGPTVRATPALAAEPKAKAKPKVKLTESALAAHDDSNSRIKVCFAMRDKGSCAAEDCPYSHKPSDVAAAKSAKSAAVSSTGKSETSFKGKSKGKGKGKSDKGKGSGKSSKASDTSSNSSVSSLTKEQKKGLSLSFPLYAHRVSER